MDYKHLLIERRDDHIAIVTLNRPDQLNTLNSTLMRELEKVTEDFHEDTDTRVVIFTGAGRYFSGGADLKEQRIPATLLEQSRAKQIGPRMIRKIFMMDQITIAAINGGAFGGGCCIVSACDFRIGDENCRAGYPESKLGMNLSWVSVPLAVHLIGPTYAKEMIILGKNNEAQTLLKWGFLNEVVPREKLLERAIEIAKEYARMPPIPAQMIKKSINHIIGA
ncbi:MAG: enoyl-CoA hydratase/isomerase family protein, partial [Promethearchaeota archaeon]